MIVPLALTLGLSQWVVRFVLSAMLGHWGRSREDV